MSFLFPLVFLFTFPTQYWGSRCKDLCYFLFAGVSSCFPDRVLLVCSRAAVYRMVCNHLNVAVHWDVCLCCFLLCHFLTAAVARQECAIACCWLPEWESPITSGPSACLPFAARLSVGAHVCFFVCVCVLRLFWWAAVPGSTGSDGRGWLWLQWWQQGGRKCRQAHKGLPMCCVLTPWYRSAASTHCLSTHHF